MSDKNLKQVFLAGILNENPIFVILLGMCPTLAVSTSGWGGLGMGIATTFVLIGSSVTVSLIRSLVAKSIRIPAYIMVIATFVTAVDLLLNAYVHNLHKALGIFIPLIVVNCIVLGRAEAFASKENVLRSAADAAGMGIGFTFALVLLGSIREFIATGMITVVDAGGILLRFAPFSSEGIDGAVMFLLPPGAFIALGTLAALRNWINTKLDEKKKAALTSAPVSTNNAESSPAGAMRIGEVTATYDDLAKVRITRETACSMAHASSLACTACRGKETNIYVIDSIGAQVGEKVAVGIDDERKVLALAALGYLFPAVAIVVGALIGDVWGAVGGLSGSLLVIAATSPALKRYNLWAKVKTVYRDGHAITTPAAGLASIPKPEKTAQTPLESKEALSNF